MEDKNLNANQSIELIQQMIRGTRRRLSFGSSNLFLLWGYLLAATAIGIFVLLKTTDCPRLAVAVAGSRSRPGA